MIAAGVELLPVKISGTAVNMAASVSCGTSGECVCARVRLQVDVDVCMSACDDVLLVGACIHCCVRGGQQFCSSLRGELYNSQMLSCSKVSVSRLIRRENRDDMHVLIFSVRSL
ncbi:hypothetical protein ATANTOWER_014501 [Ataeniobius toweri]|uniref:Uncharacterized protein n=1 Tax=Ataeniobius toweri TaxID=208326 RepID=A0ABU7A9U3_9TELE|nr:hypothetical protein [Ataeniobius toweri]